MELSPYDGGEKIIELVKVAVGLRILYFFFDRQLFLHPQNINDKKIYKGASFLPRDV